MKTRKIVALLLAVVMVFAMSASAFAINADDTYSSYTFTDLGLTLQVSNGIEGLTITGSGLYATIAPDGTNEMPQALSLIFSNSNGSNFDTTSVSVTWDHAAIFDFYTEGDDQDPKYGYGAVELNGDSTSLTIRRGDKQCIVNINAPTAQVAGQGVAAYLPAPGQFVNEGATGSGWGGPFTKAGASTLKSLVEGYVTTGISLGAFGGYAVLDFGAIERNADDSYKSGGIYNDPNNAYGVDFTLFGNAMYNWAEPGCVQVSQNGTTWYNIAGSLHYRTPSDTTSGAIWNYSATYTNPVSADDDLATGSTGTTGNNVAYTATYKTRPTSTAETESGSVVFNNWHRHNYFPLYNNYFVSVNGHSKLDGLLPPISATMNLSSFGAYTAKTSSAAATLQLNGVKLVSPSNSVQPDDYLFGYFDCHPNGLRSGAQVNPYVTGRTGNDTSNGDPIDISWAVNPDGTPANLDAIRYVRCYTGVMQMNGAMGESSSELLGSHKAVTKGTGVGSAPVVSLSGDTGDIGLDSSANMTVQEYTELGMDTVSVSVSGATYMFINGVATNTATIDLSDGNTHLVQIISQSGTASPYIVVLELSK